MTNETMQVLTLTDPMRPTRTERWAPAGQITNERPKFLEDSVERANALINFGNTHGLLARRDFSP
jgi:hypothetical protein